MTTVLATSRPLTRGLRRAGPATLLFVLLAEGDDVPCAAEPRARVSVNVTAAARPSDGAAIDLEQALISGEFKGAVRPARDGAMELTLPRAERWPGVSLIPAVAWNRGDSRGLEALVENPTAESSLISVRVDDMRGVFNAAAATLPPHGRAWITVQFGANFDKEAPSVERSRLKRILIYGAEKAHDSVVRVHKLRWIPSAEVSLPRYSAAAAPKPAPPRRSILSTAILSKVQGARARLGAEGVDIVMAAERAVLEAQFRPALDLRQYNALSVELADCNSADVHTSSVTLCSGPASCLSSSMASAEACRPQVLRFADAPRAGLGSGATAAAPLIGSMGALHSADERGFDNGLVTDLVISLQGRPGAHFRVARATAQVARNSYLGEGPPIAGKWLLSFADEFDGDHLDPAVWTPRLPWIGPIPWELQRYSEENVVVRDGHLLIRAEKKRGHLYDDPRYPERDFTTGAVTTYPKWRWHYGYVEARLRAPRAAGLWPAFWTMPDRGPTRDGRALAKSERRDTADGGMEIDIFEHVTRWGPYRYNAGAHWDGYGSEHKMVGNSLRYFERDDDGYVRVGLLWQPGLLAWFANGREVARWQSERVASVPMSLKFTIQMGGMAGTEVAEYALPDELAVDWVRVWQDAEAAAAGGIEVRSGEDT